MFREVTECRVCGNRNLVTVLDLGEQYLTGVFPAAISPNLSKGPVQLMKCAGPDPRTSCGLVQMRHSFAAEEMYGEAYGYRSGLNRAMVSHLQGKADRLQALVKPGPDDLVLDIGSNDGTSLARYPENGPLLVGIDPSARKFRKYYRPDINLIVDFFSLDVFRQHFGDRKAKIVTSIAMFYDLEQPQGFVDDVAAVLAEDGVWHLEQSYLPSMLRTNSYDTACHEHIEYYSLGVVAKILEAAVLKVVNVVMNTAQTREIRQRLHVVAEAVLMRDPRHRYEARPIVDGAGEIVARHAAVAVLHDPQRDPARLLQMPIQNERGLVMQFVDDDVVAGFQVERGGDDVLAFAGGVEEADLLGRCAAETRHLVAHLVGRLQHLIEADRFCGFALGKGARRGGNWQRHRRDVSGVQVEPLADYRKIVANAERVVAARRPVLRVQRQQRGGAGRDFDELSAIDLHPLLRSICVCRVGLRGGLRWSG